MDAKIIHYNGVYELQLSNGDIIQDNEPFKREDLNIIARAIPNLEGGIWVSEVIGYERYSRLPTKALLKRVAQPNVKGLEAKIIENILSDRGEAFGLGALLRELIKETKNIRADKVREKEKRAKERAKEAEKNVHKEVMFIPFGNSNPIRGKIIGVYGDKRYGVALYRIKVAGVKKIYWKTTHSDEIELI